MKVISHKQKISQRRKKTFALLKKNKEYSALLDLYKVTYNPRIALHEKKESKAPLLLIQKKDIYYLSIRLDLFITLI